MLRPALIVLAAVATACSSTQLPDIPQAGPSTTAPTAPPTTPPPGSLPSVPTPPDDGTVTARLAALAPDGRLLVLDAGEWVVWSDTDAVVTQFDWSPDGRRLAWTEVTEEGTRLVVGDGQTVEPVATDRPPFFVSWSPDGASVAHLGSDSDDVTLARSPLTGGTTELARSTPLFVSWSDTGQVLTHEGGSTLRLLDDTRRRPVARTTSAFGPPAWIDERRAIAVVNVDGRAVLAIVDVIDGRLTPLFEVEGSIVFALSPDGRRLAYQIQSGASVDDRPVANQTGDPPDVLVVDLETEEVQLAFVGAARWLDWSPDSTRLAALIEVDDLTWRLWEDGEIVRTPPLTISPVMADTFVPFFDQYTQTLTGWSPTSDRYAFAAAVGGPPGVHVLDAEVGAAPVRVGAGVMVAWAPAE